MGIEHRKEAAARRSPVHAAEDEILEELRSITERVEDDSNAERAAIRRLTRIAILLLGVCVVMTSGNLLRERGAAVAPAQLEHYARESLDLFAGDIEAYRDATGGYPEEFENVFDDDDWQYERISADRFRVVVGLGENALAYDSADRIARLTTPGGAQ
jgi:hypothetical protein